MYRENYFGQYVEDIEKLDLHQKVRLGVLILREQRICVVHFDDVYDQELLPFYDSIIKELELTPITEFPSSSLIHLRNVSDKRIPDTDIFPSEYGTFAQYAMISACHLIAFATEHNVKRFYQLIEIYIDNIYAQNQCSEHPLNNVMLLEHITGIWGSLISSSS